MAVEKGLTKQEIISTLTKAVHAGGATKRKKGEKLPKLTWTQKREARIKKLMEYSPVGTTAVMDDERFFAGLIAWNHQKGSVRDAKVALPVIGLASQDTELIENALAHMADLRPREFLRACEFARERKIKTNMVRRLVARWLKDLEKSFPEWEKTAMLHKHTLAQLYAKYRIKPMPIADEILFKGIYPPGSRFAMVRDLKNGSPEQIMGTIQKLKLPFLVVREAVGVKLKEPEVLAAVIGAMSSTELVTNMAVLEKLGVKNQPITRAALEKALEAAGTSKSVQKRIGAVLKASKAADAQGDEVLAGKLKALQEKQLDTLKGIEGNWLILADKSSSMDTAIEVAKEIAAVLTRMVKGRVLLVFFDNAPTPFEINPGTSLESIKNATRFIKAGGGTHAGIGLDWLKEQKIAVDGIVIVGDGGENDPIEFKRCFEKYCAAMGVDPNIYFYQLKPSDQYANQRDTLSPQVKMTVTDLRGGVDYTSLPNVIQTMRVGRFSLVDEIMATQLRTLDEVLDRTTDMQVIAGRLVTA